MRCGLQHTVVTENDHQERPWAFFAPAKCLWFREFEAQITSNSCHELKHDTIFEWRCVLKMNFSGTTKKLMAKKKERNEQKNPKNSIRDR